MTLKDHDILTDVQLLLCLLTSRRGPDLTSCKVSSERRLEVSAQPFLNDPSPPALQDTEGVESDEEELDDDTMMELDQNISALFSEQKKRIQAKKDEKENMRKEKALVRDFKIKVTNE